MRRKGEHPIAAMPAGGFQRVPVLWRWRWKSGCHAMLWLGSLLPSPALAALQDQFL